MGDRMGSREAKGSSLKKSKKNPGCAVAKAKKTPKVVDAILHSLSPPVPSEGAYFDCAVALLSRQFDRDRDRVLQRAQTDQVSVMISWFADIEKQSHLVDLSKANSGTVYFVTGVHPDNIDRTNKKNHETWLEKVEEYGKKPECLGILSGLNLTREMGGHFPQESMLRSSCALADKLMLPLILHCPEPKSLERAIEILTEESWTSSPDSPNFGHKRVLLHDAMTACGTDPEKMETVVNAGFFFIISAVGLTEGDPELIARARECVKRIPTTHLLTGTDSPWKTPQNIPDEYLRTLRNEPSNLPFICLALSEALSVDPAKLSDQIRTNSLTAFGLEFIVAGGTAAAGAVGGGESTVVVAAAAAAAAAPMSDAPDISGDIVISKSQAAKSVVEHDHNSKKVSKKDKKLNTQVSSKMASRKSSISAMRELATDRLTSGDDEDDNEEEEEKDSAGVSSSGTSGKKPMKDHKGKVASAALLDEEDDSDGDEDQDGEVDHDDDDDDEDNDDEFGGSEKHSKPDMPEQDDGNDDISAAVSTLSGMRLNDISNVAPFNLSPELAHPDTIVVTNEGAASDADSVSGGVSGASTAVYGCIKCRAHLFAQGDVFSHGLQSTRTVFKVGEEGLCKSVVFLPYQGGRLLSSSLVQHRVDIAGATGATKGSNTTSEAALSPSPVRVNGNTVECRSCGIKLGKVSAGEAHCACGANVTGPVLRIISAKVDCFKTALDQSQLIVLARREAEELQRQADLDDRTDSRRATGDEKKSKKKSKIISMNKGNFSSFRNKSFIPNASRSAAKKGANEDGGDVNEADASDNEPDLDDTVIQVEES